MIGMILLAVLAVMIFFGITSKFFGKMGIANWVAFLVVLAFAVAAVFPPLIAGNVSFSYAGFFLPLLLGVVTMFAIGANSSLLRAIVGALAIAGVVVAARVAFVPTANYNAAIASILIVGLAGGAVSFVIGQGRLAVLSAVTVGIVLGDFICAMLFRFVTGATGSVLQLGQNGIFDSIVMAAIVGEVTLEVANLIRRAVVKRNAVPSGVPVSAHTEAGQDNPVQENDLMIQPLDDDDLFDDYFNDDID